MLAKLGPEIYVVWTIHYLLIGTIFQSEAWRDDKDWRLAEYDRICVWRSDSALKGSKMLHPEAIQECRAVKNLTIRTSSEIVRLKNSICSRVPYSV